MSAAFELMRLAIHYVDRSADEPVYAPCEQDVAALHPAIAEFMTDLVLEVWEAPDTGTTRSGYFAPDDHPRLGPSFVKGRRDQLLRPGKDGFFTASRELAHHLHRRSHPRASPGLLAVMQFLAPGAGDPFAALLKIRHRDARFVRVLSDALTQLEVEQVENMLVHEIQKGAIIPHPHKPGYDLKVIDKQATDDPAVYFTESFLGCSTKKSDEHQVIRLVPEMRKYAALRELPVATEELPQVVAALQKQRGNVTTAVVARAIQERGALGPDFQPDDFQTYVDKESDLGPLDIPIERLLKSGKQARHPRSFVYRFHDPHLSGITLSGPPDKLAQVLSVDGDTVTFHIETDRSGFSVGYR
jgi:hypothetical protein